MPLAEIRLVLADPSPARIDAYERDLSDELAERSRILDYVRRFLKEEQMFEVRTKTLGPVRYVSRTANVYVKDLMHHIVDTGGAAGSAQGDGAGLRRLSR